MSNWNHKPVSLTAGDGVILSETDNQNYVEYYVYVDEDRIKMMAEKAIIQGAVERAELESKIAKLEARIEELERPREMQTVRRFK